MMNSLKQKIKLVCAINIFIVSIIIVFNQKCLNNNVAMIKKNQKNDFAQIKYAAGSEIHEICKNDGEEIFEQNDIDKNNNSIFRNKINLDLKDKASPNNIENINTKFFEDYMIINFEKPEDNGTNYKYIIKNNGKEKNISFYAKSNIKGYSYVIDNNMTNESTEELNKFDETPIVLSILDWEKDYYLHVRTFDESGNYSKDKTFKLDLPSKGVNIKYVDINSNLEIEKNEMITGVVNQSYNALEMFKEINGYQLLKKEGIMEGKLKKEVINVTYEYVKNANTIINFIDKATGKVLSEPIKIEGYEGKEIKIDSKEISGYTYETKTLSEKMNAGINNINIYYIEIPKGTINIKYLDKDTDKEIAKRETINDFINHTYNTFAKKIEGYELEKIPENVSGVIKSKDESVIYYYKKAIEDHENKIDKRQIKYVDYNTKKVLKAEKITLGNDNKTRLNIKKIEGYKLMSINDFDENDSIIDELINSLDSDNSFIQKKENDYKVIIPKKVNSNVKDEYEIVMNCDDSDYIIYYKK